MGFGKIRGGHRTRSCLSTASLVFVRVMSHAMILIGIKFCPANWMATNLSKLHAHRARSAKASSSWESVLLSHPSRRSSRYCACDKNAWHPHRDRVSSARSVLVLHHFCIEIVSNNCKWTLIVCEQCSGFLFDVVFGRETMRIQWSAIGCVILSKSFFCACAVNEKCLSICFGELVRVNKRITCPETKDRLWLTNGEKYLQIHFVTNKAVFSSTAFWCRYFRWTSSWTVSE